eukprot:TRINITY_DN17886_c0_g1_i1.p1 TRINITY_DN17886_c0_g1~~TRINITY_DN17886_c0_g1_i1.p1  ORF type:complete len:143 (+),score=45.17 TRINITY_DN17886_c0_g1_i1:5-433(+)
MIRRPQVSTQSRSSAASDVYKRQIESSQQEMTSEQRLAELERENKILIENMNLISKENLNLKLLQDKILRQKEDAICHEAMEPIDRNKYDNLIKRYRKYFKDNTEALTVVEEYSRIVMQLYNVDKYKAELQEEIQQFQEAIQ